MPPLSFGRKCKAELKSAKLQNEELRRTLEIMEGQIRARVRNQCLEIIVVCRISVLLSSGTYFCHYLSRTSFALQDRERGDGVNREQSVDTRVEQLQTGLIELESR